MMLYVLPPPATAGPPSPWSTILQCNDDSGQELSSTSATTTVVDGDGHDRPMSMVANGGRLTYKRNASNNRRVKAWLNAVQRNNRPPPPRKPPVDVIVAAGHEVRLLICAELYIFLNKIKIYSFYV